MSPKGGYFSVSKNLKKKGDIMATIAMEGRQRTFEVEGSRSRKPSLLKRAGGMVLGLLSEPSGRHAVNHFKAEQQKPGVFSRMLGNLVGIDNSTTRQETSPMPKLRSQRAQPEGRYPERSPRNWDTRMLDLMDPSNTVSDLPSLNAALATSTDYNQLERAAWQANAIAQMASGPEKEAADNLIGTTGKQLKKPPQVTPYQNRFSLRDRHKARIAAEAEANATTTTSEFPTVTLPIQP